MGIKGKALVSGTMAGFIKNCGETFTGGAGLIRSLAAIEQFRENVVKIASDYQVPDIHCVMFLVAVDRLKEESDRVRQVDVSEALNIDRTTTMKIVDLLEAGMFLERLRDPTDRRAHNLNITGPGMKVVDAFFEAFLPDTHA